MRSTKFKSTDFSPPCNLLCFLVSPCFLASNFFPPSLSSNWFSSAFCCNHPKTLYIRVFYIDGIYRLCVCVPACIMYVSVFVPVCVCGGGYSGGGWMWVWEGVGGWPQF